MKLYEVTLTAKMLVGADDENKACLIGEDYLASAISDGGVQPEIECANEIKRVEDIPGEWRGGLIYHSGKDDILAESIFVPPPLKTDPNQMALPWPVTLQTRNEIERSQEVPDWYEGDTMM